MTYLQCILKRHDNGIIKKIYIAQEISPCKGDWVLKIEEDKIKYDIDFSDKK